MTMRFVSEPIIPLSGAADTRAMAIGEPGLPARFVWRDKEHAVDKVLEKWKETPAGTAATNATSESIGTESEPSADTR